MGNPNPLTPFWTPKGDKGRVKKVDFLDFLLVFWIFLGLEFVFIAKYFVLCLFLVLEMSINYFSPHLTRIFSIVTTLF